MASREDLITACREALADDCPVDYDFDDDQIAGFINRVLKSIYPALYRLVVSDEIRVLHTKLTYDLSTLHPPVDGLIGVWIVTTDNEYFLRHHYVWDQAARLLTFQPGFIYTILRDTASVAQTGDKLHVVYRGQFTSLDDDDQECELAEPEEELIVRGVQELGLRKMRNAMIQGRTQLPSETWNEFERIIQSVERHFQAELKNKRMVRHGGYPSTRRPRQRSTRISH